MIWSTSFILMDRSVAVFSPVATSLWRMFFAAIVVTVIALIRKKSLSLPRKFWLPVALIGGLFYVIPNVIQPYVMSQGLDHGVMGSIVVFVPLMTILVSIPILKVFPSSRATLGVLGGLVCFGVLAFDSESRGVDRWLVILALGAPLFNALSNTLYKKFLQGFPVLPMTVWTQVAGCVTMLTISLATDPAGIIGMGETANPHNVSWMTAAISVLLLGVFATGIALMLFNFIIVREGPLFAGMVTYVVPLGAIIISSLDGEQVNSLQISAVLGALTMVALVQYRGASSRIPALQTASTGDVD